MKKLLLILACFIGLSTFAQETVDLSPYSTIDPMYSPPRDTFDLEFLFPCTAFVGEYGVESNGTDIYVAQWLGDSIGKYDQMGNVIDMFVIPGVERVRDMAYDGQYYYGGNNNDYIYVMDFENKVLVNTLQMGYNIRAVAYDPMEDVLWTSSNWSPEFHKIDKQGNILASWVAGGITMNAICGLAFDNYTGGGPSLWGFSQDSSGAMIVKYDIATQSQTGNMIDVTSLSNAGSIAGGLFINDMPIRSGIALGGCIQNDVIFAFDLNYANQMVVDIENQNMITKFDIYPNPVSDVLNINIEVNNKTNVSCRIFNQLGQMIFDQNTKQSLVISTDNLNPGTYIVQVSGDRYSMTKQFIKN